MNKMQIETCVLCGKCLNVCPIFKSTLNEEDSPRAKAFLYNKIDLLPISEKDIKDNLIRCLGCGRCHEVCTQRIYMPDLVSEIRAKYRGLKSRLYSTAIGSLNLIPEYFLKILFEKKFSPINSLDIFTIKEKVPKIKEKVVLFGGCFGKYFRKDLIKKAKNVLDLYFESVEILDWTCCGYPFYFAGDREKEKRSFQENFKLWNDLGRPKIVVFCATCYHGLKRYEKFILSDREKKAWLRSICYLTELINYQEFETVKSLEGVILHKSCHIESLFFEKMKLFFKYMDISYEVVDHCCGFGGCTKLEYPELSNTIGKRFWNNIKENKIVVTSCSGCIMQLALTKDNSYVCHWLDLILI